MRSTLPFVLLCTGLAQPQQQPQATAHQFLPPNYDCEFYVDVERTLENGIYEALTGPIGSMLVGRFKEVWGFDMDELTRVRGVPVYTEKDGNVQTKQIWVLEGSKDVKVPAKFEEWYEVNDLEIGGKEVVSIKSWGEPEIYYQPRDGMIVLGSESLMRQALEGATRGGRPSAELMPLVAQSGVFAHAIISLNSAMRSDSPEFMKEMLSDGDPLTVMAYRFREIASSDPDDEPTFRIEGAFRFRDGEAGPKKFETVLRKHLKDLEKHKQFGALKKLLRQIEIANDRGEVVVSVELGDERKAIGALQALMIPMMTVRMTEVAAEAQVIEIVDTVEVEEEEDKDKKKGKDEDVPVRPDRDR